MKQEDALNHIKQALVDKGCTSVLLFHEKSEPDVKKKIPPESAHFIRLGLEIENFEELADQQYIQELIVMAEKAFKRKHIELTHTKLGVALVSSTDNPFDELAKLYPDIPASKYEVLFISLSEEAMDNK